MEFLNHLFRVVFVNFSRRSHRCMFRLLGSKTAVKLDPARMLVAVTIRNKE